MPRARRTLYLPVILSFARAQAQRAQDLRLLWIISSGQQTLRKVLVQAGHFRLRLSS